MDAIPLRLVIRCIVRTYGRYASTLNLTRAPTCKRADKWVAIQNFSIAKSLQSHLTRSKLCRRAELNQTLQHFKEPSPPRLIGDLLEQRSLFPVRLASRDVLQNARKKGVQDGQLELVTPRTQIESADARELVGGRPREGRRMADEKILCLAVQAHAGTVARKQDVGAARA